MCGLVNLDIRLDRLPIIQVENLKVFSSNGLSRGSVTTVGQLGIKGNRMAPTPVIESVVFPAVVSNSAAEPVDENSRAKITTWKEREFVTPVSVGAIRGGVTRINRGRL